MKIFKTDGFAWFASMSVLSLVLALFLVVPTILAQNKKSEEKESVQDTQKVGKHIIAYLDTMRLDLKDGETLVHSFPIVSKGKPGSYYETPGGVYINDYKTPLHFSSFGQVYLPYSVHLFGNFFIHGIPYYPSGERVSSSYSGGCLRIEDTQMKIVYDFIEKGTPIIVTNESPLPVPSNYVTEKEMLLLMTAMISLEFLPQDDIIVVHNKETTRKHLIKNLLQGDLSIAKVYASAFGEEMFVRLMNEKAKAIGLQETMFTSVTTPPTTSGKDLLLMYEYVYTHKTFLLTLYQETKLNK